MSRRSIELVIGERHIGKIVLAPGAKGYAVGTYLWVGDDICFGYTKAHPRQLSAFAHAILRAIGEESTR